MLACLTILLTTLVVWTHQVALNANRFTYLVENVVTDPAVTDPISKRISIQVVDALGVQERLEARLPDAIKPLAGALAASVTERIDQRLKVALQDSRLQGALVGTLGFTHAQIVRLLRGETDNLAVTDGYVTLDVFPVVGAALTELQSMGLIPADVQLPDLTSPDAPDVLAQRLETSLGVTLPPDFGTIQLMPAARLATAQTIVRAFDLVVILLLILSIALVALTLWLAPNRRRMLIYLGIGVLVVFLLARLAIGAAENAIIGGIADGDVAGAARTMVDATLQDLRGITVLILIGTVILVIAAYLWGRPKWVMATTSYVSDTAGRAGSAAGAAASGGAASVAGRAPDRETVEDTVRENRSAVEKYGIGIIVFVLVWIGARPGGRTAGAALVIGFLLLLRAIDGGSDDEAAEVRCRWDHHRGASCRRDRDPGGSARRGRGSTVDPGGVGGRRNGGTGAAPAAAARSGSAAPAAPAASAAAAPAKKPATPRKPAAKKAPAKPKQPPSQSRRQPDPPRPPARPVRPRQTRTGASSFSMRIAVALNSAVPDFGSVASIVSRLTARDLVLEVQGHERQARPERRVDPDRDLDLAAARDDPDDLAVGQAVGRRILGARVEALAAAQRRGVAAVWTPVLYESRRRPVVRRIGKSSVSLSTGGSWSTGMNGTRLPGTGSSHSREWRNSSPGWSRRSTATGCHPAPRGARSSSRRGPARGAGPRPRRPRGRPRPIRRPSGSPGRRRSPGRRARPRAGRPPCARAGRAAPSW